MTDGSNPSGPELKPQFDFSPRKDSPDQSSALLFSRELRAEFYDRDGQSYSCEDNKVWLSRGTQSQIHVTSEFKGEQVKRLNDRYSLEYLRSHHSPGDPISFFPEKVSLNDKPCVDIVSTWSGGSSSTESETADKYEVSWYPKEELVVVVERSTRTKQIIFHLFNFVPFDDGSVSCTTDGSVSASEIMASVETSFSFDCGEWEITISQNPLHKPKHVGRIQRKDGKLFDGEEVKKCIKRLGFVFSLVRGAWCKPVCLVGYNERGQRIWEALSSPSKFKGSIPGQFHYSKDSELEHVTSLLMNKIYSETKEKGLQRALLKIIREYVVASSCEDHNQGRDIEDGIVHVRKAIEYISRFFKVTEEKELVFEKLSKKNHTDSDNLKNLSCVLGVSEVQLDGPRLLLLDVPRLLLLFRQIQEVKPMAIEELEKKLGKIRNDIAHINEKDDEVDEIEGDVDEGGNERFPDIPLAERRETYFLGLIFVEQFIHAAYRAPWAAEE